MLLSATLRQKLARLIATYSLLFLIISLVDCFHLLVLLLVVMATLHQKLARLTATCYDLLLFSLILVFVQTFPHQ